MDALLDQSNSGLRVAVIFRTHFWDAFAARQFQRLTQKVGGGDVYVLVDETSGPVEGIPHEKVVRMTETDVLALGFPRAGKGNLLWFNGDYPLYYFMKEHGFYDYYVLLEYDVALNVDVDPLVARVAAAGIDFVGLTKGEPVREWPWLDTCRDAYPLEDIQYKLICLSVYSARAVCWLANRRLELAAQVRDGSIKAWPFCEGFIATEMARNDFVTAELTDFVDTGTYDFWPPYVEADLPEMLDRPLIHPVLDRDRYVGSLLKYKVGLNGYFNVNSTLHRKLRRLPVPLYVKTLTNSFMQKALRNLKAGRVVSR